MVDVGAPRVGGWVDMSLCGGVGTASRDVAIRARKGSYIVMVQRHETPPKQIIPPQKGARRSLIWVDQSSTRVIRRSFLLC